MITPQQEQAILDAARNTDEDLDALLRTASETMEETAFNLLCDKVYQIMSEHVHDLRGWQDVEVDA